MARTPINWIEHDGTGMPVAGDLYVHIETRDGYQSAARADAFTAEKNEGFDWWRHYSDEEMPNGRDVDDDIVRYAIGASL